MTVSGKRDFQDNPHDILRTMVIAPSVGAVKKPTKTQLLIAPAVPKSEKLLLECNENFQAYVHDKLDKIESLLQVLLQRTPDNEEEFDTVEAKTKLTKVTAFIQALGEDAVKESNKLNLMRAINAQVFNAARLYY